MESIEKLSLDAPPALIRLPRWLVDLLLAMLIVGASFAPVPGQEYVLPCFWALALVAVPVVLLPLRRKQPAITLAVALVVFAAISAGGASASGAAMAAAVMMFSFTSRFSRRIGLTVTISVVVLFVVISIPSALQEGFSPRDVQFVLTVAFFAAAGDATRSRKQYIAAFEARALLAEHTRESEAQRRVTEERLRIARDLHDTVAHQIAVISLNAGVASSVIDAAPEKAKQSLSNVRAAARTVLAEIGDLLAVLRSGEEGTESSPAPQPDLSALDHLLDQFRSAGMTVDLRVSGPLDLITGTPSVVAYRVVQEALTNAHKHGVGGDAAVEITASPSALSIVVTNALASEAGGHNHKPEGSHHGNGVGLMGLRERIAAVRGVFEAGPYADGWRVAATIPHTPEAAS